jgi:hypothetical protein
VLNQTIYTERENAGNAQGAHQQQDNLFFAAFALGDGVHGMAFIVLV